MYGIGKPIEISYFSSGMLSKSVECDDVLSTYNGLVVNYRLSHN